MSHATAISADELLESHNPSAKYVKEKTASIKLVTMLVPLADEKNKILPDHLITFLF